MTGLVNIDVGGIAAGAFDLIDKLFTTDKDRMDAKIKVIELQQAGQLAQIGVNQNEAKHENVFVSGWRPFIGWVCGLAFAYHFLVQPFLVFAAWLVANFYGFFLPVDQLPSLSLSELMPVLMGMLGLGAYRTYEKFTGTNTNR